MTPIYWRELKVQGGLVVASALTSYTLHHLLNIKRLASIAKGIGAILIPLELMRVAFLLKDLQQQAKKINELEKRPTQNELEKKRGELAALATANKRLQEAQLPRGAVCVVQVIAGQPRAPRLHQQMSLAAWQKKGSKAKHLLFKVPRFPQGVLGLCRSLEELQLGKMHIPSFPALMQAVQNSKTLQVFQLQSANLPTKEDIAALQTMLKGNTSLQRCSITFGSGRSGKLGQVCLQVALQQSKIPTCFILAGRQLIAQKVKGKITASTVKIYMNIPPTLVEKAAAWLVGE